MAKVLSSISGNLISAASAGFAPTNSGDVSAIASAYQVVSATGTQLYAGTAHVTSINGAPISASRAGNAANASMANSAYYDGTGRLISSLPDSATVSSIASSYAPTFGLNAGKISSINGSALDTPTGSQVVTATGSGWFGGVIGISSINGSALSAKEAYSASRATYDDFGDSIRANYAKQSAFSSVSSTVANNSASWGQGGSVTSPSGTIMVMNGNEIEATNSAVLTASSEPGFTTSFDAGDQIPSWTVQELYAGTLPGSGATLYIPTQNISPDNTAIISGKDSNMAIVTASGLASGTPFAIYLGPIVNAISASAYSYIHIDGDVTADKEGGITVTGIGELAWKSAVDNVTNTVSSNSATWGQGGVDSATVSSIASSYAHSAVSGVENTVSSNSASWGTPSLPITGSDGGDDSATYSIYGAVWNGHKRTADVNPQYIRIRSASDPNNGDTIVRAQLNQTGLTFTTSASTATVDISSIDRWNTVSGKADSSALSSYALSADVSGCIDSATCSAIASSYANDVSAAVSGTVDTVSTQSANWGGSALALSAGPGVSLTKSGNTLIAGLDETVLWSGATTSITAITLNESYANFDRVRFYWNPWTDTMSWQVTDIPGIVSYINLSCGWANNSQRALFVYEFSSPDKLTFSQVNGAFTNITGTAWTTATGCKVYKVVGINRTAGV